MLSKPQKSERENDSQSPPNFSNSNESMGNETMNNTDLEFEYLVRNEALKMRTTFLKKDQVYCRFESSIEIIDGIARKN